MKLLLTPFEKYLIFFQNLKDLKYDIFTKKLANLINI